MGLATCKGIFRGSMREFFSVFSVFLEVQTVMVAKFYGLIYAMEEAQKMGSLMYDLNVILPWFVLHLLLGLIFHGGFAID